MKISVIHPFYKHNFALEKHIQNWNSWEDKYKKSTEIIIVDDGSPESIDLNLFKKANGLDIKVYRILKDIMWNVTGARNLGITQSTGDWLFPLDFDMSVLNITLDGIYRENLDSNTTYWPRLWFPSKNKPHRMRRPHCNSFFIERETMFNSGLYDEDFAGRWGYEDIFFHDISLGGVKRKVIDYGYLRWYKNFACPHVVKNPRDLTDDNYKKFCNKKKHYEKGWYKNGPILRFEWKRLI